MIYVPDLNYSCFVVQDKDTIRAYKNLPQINGSSDYDDIYINSHYLTKPGYQSWGNWNQTLPICIDKSNLTTDYYYRNDINDILTLFFFIIGFIGFIFFLCLKSLLRGLFK